MISPALTIGRIASVPLYYAESLPSMAAAVRARNGPVTRAGLADVEQYATHEYLADLLAGVGDPKLLAQMSARVAALTGLDPRSPGGSMDVSMPKHSCARSTVPTPASPAFTTRRSPARIPIPPQSAPRTRIRCSKDSCHRSRKRCSRSMLIG